MGGKPYNGFSPAERQRGGEAIREALASKTLSYAASCSSCSRPLTKPHDWHLEDYTNPLSAFPVCRRCHQAIHVRFSRPDYWRSFVNTVTPSCWAKHLCTDPATLHRPFDVTYPAGHPLRLRLRQL